LVIELESLAHKTSFSTGELYSNIFCRSQLRLPEDEQGTERHPAPIHLVLTNDSQHKRSIHLSKRRILLPLEKEPNQLPAIQNLQTVVGENGEAHSSVVTNTSVFSEDAASSREASPCFTLGTKIPRLALAIRFHESFQADEMTTLLFTEWLKEFPVIAEQVRVEARFDSFSSLLIISIPIALFAFLPAALSVIPLGPITSVNRILPQIQPPVSTEECVRQSDPSKSPDPVERAVESGVPETEFVPKPTSTPLQKATVLAGSEPQGTGSRRSSISTEQYPETTRTSASSMPSSISQDIDMWNYHIDLEAPGKDSQNYVANIVDASCKYTRVSCLLFSFQDEDPNLLVKYEINRLEKLFLETYNFEVQRYLIPSKRSHYQVIRRVRQFLGDESSTHLKIFYYGGHGETCKSGQLKWLLG
jgi:hypothetical protein